QWRGCIRGAYACVLDIERGAVGDSTSAARANGAARCRGHQRELLLVLVHFDKSLRRADRLVRRGAGGLRPIDGYVLVRTDDGCDFALDWRGGRSRRLRAGMSDHGTLAARRYRRLTRGRPEDGAVESLSAMKAWLKRWWFGLRGKDPEAVVVSFR